MYTQVELFERFNGLTTTLPKDFFKYQGNKQIGWDFDENGKIKFYNPEMDRLFQPENREELRLKFKAINGF